MCLYDKVTFHNESPHSADDKDNWDTLIENAEVY